jgi:hypothetical protein
MRKVNVLEFVSLDGVIQAPGGPEEGVIIVNYERAGAVPTGSL